MEIIEFEPQLASSAGHYNRYVRVMAGEAARRGMRLSVVTSKYIVPRFREMLEEMGVNVMPAFEHLPYRLADQQPQRDEFSRNVADVALACLKERPGALPVWLSGTGALLGAACRFAEEVRRPFLFQMLDFAEDWPVGELAAPAPLRDAVTRAVSCGLNIQAQSPLIAQHLASEIGTPVGVFPAILDLQPLKPRPRRNRPLVGITNMLRGSKKIGRALSVLMAYGDEISLLLHTGQGTTDEIVRELEARVNELSRRFELRKPQVEIVAGVLTADRYAEMWQSLDCTVMPYDPARYLRQGSGMLFEGLADGIIPIAPLGTSMAATMADLGLGFIYDPEDRDGLYGAIGRMLENFDDMSRRMLAYAPIYRAENAPERIFDAVLKASGA